MLASELVQPRTIAIVGGSNNLHKPGGMVVRNILKGNFTGQLFIVNPGEKTVQGQKCYAQLKDLPETDLAILAVAAKYCVDAVKFLAHNKHTRGFIVLSAGFGETGPEGAAMEKEMAETVRETGGTLIGPNCIGVVNPHYQGVFTAPAPRPAARGCDFISGSGATAVFIMEAGIPLGLSFSSVYSVGNSAQTGVEEVLQHMDETFDRDESSGVKLMYLETIRKPDLLLKHAASLVRKGCRLAVIKAGTSEAGSRAVSSHTGALGGSDLAAEALFRKAGIVRCTSREELVAVASVFMHGRLRGNRLAIVTNAGGPAVMLTDALSQGGMQVPRITHPRAGELLANLHPGSSVANPVDILATGTAEQLGTVLDFCGDVFDEIDGVVVIFGSPGLGSVDEAFRILDAKMKTSSKPVYPVLPSAINAEAEIETFHDLGRIHFQDEVTLGKALSKVYHCTGFGIPGDNGGLDHAAIRNEIRACGEGYLAPEPAGRILDATGIRRVSGAVAETKVDAVLEAEKLGFPVVMKVIGPLHKSDVGGVALNITGPAGVSTAFERLMNIGGAGAVLIQEMRPGIEVFAGVSREGDFGHLVLCGMGGIHVEALKDVSAGLAPLSDAEAGAMIQRLRGYPLLRGNRGRGGIDVKAYGDVLVRLSWLAVTAPEIAEIDLNPLIGTPGEILAADVRIRIGTG